MELFLGDLIDTIHSMSVRLLDFHKSTGVRPYDPSMTKKACLQCCLLCTALNEHFGDDIDFAIKPKLHMFQEAGEYMSEILCDPSEYWAYRDESHVGFIARIASSRGGGRHAPTIPTLVLQRFRALSSLSA